MAIQSAEEFAADLCRWIALDRPTDNEVAGTITARDDAIRAEAKVDLEIEMLKLVGAELSRLMSARAPDLSSRSVAKAKPAQSLAPAAGERSEEMGDAD